MEEIVIAEISKLTTVQLEQLLNRIERLEAKLGVASIGVGEGRYGNETQQNCSLPQVKPRVFAPSLSPERVRLIQMVEKKWANGTKLRYYFFENGSFSAGNEQKDIRPLAKVGVRIGKKR